MNLDLTETQSLLQETVVGYLEEKVSFDQIRNLESENGWDHALWLELCEQDWIGLPFAEANGGGGGSLIDVGLLVESCARRAVVVPILEVVVAGRVLESAGPDQKPLLSGVLSGGVIPVPALLEAGDHFDTVELRLRSGKLDGEKAFVDYGQFATHHIVAARENGDVGLFLVDANASGVSHEPLRSIGRTPVCVTRYEGVVAERIGDASAWHSVRRLGRLLAAIQCVGSMQQALEMAVQYACVREQFGKPIGSFQAVRHHCANMLSSVSSARILAFEALSSLDRGEPDDVRIAAAKAAASRAAPEVLMLAHQIHGGNGVIEENDLYFFTLRGKERSLAWGSVEECLGVMADALEEPIDWL
jgi:alkylation response protein AidB-like acyl-CoA dehydrogenase